MKYKKTVFWSDIYTKRQYKKINGGSNTSLENRIAEFRKVKDLLQINKQSCLEKQGNGYTLNNIVNLEKQFGTDGVNGIIYSAKVISATSNASKTSYPVVAKIMAVSKENKNEINLSIRISNKILQQSISRHFLLCYGYIHCKNTQQQMGVYIENEIEKVSDYLVSFNEMATGDLEKLFNEITDANIVQNILAQCLLSIMTFHKLGWIHQDTHSANFLYHYSDINRGNYYHYRILNQDYYIQDFGYTIMLYDFGYAEADTGEAPEWFHWNNHDLMPFFPDEKDIQKYRQQVSKYVYDSNDYRRILKSISNRGFSELYMPVNNLQSITIPNMYTSENEMIEDIMKELENFPFILKTLDDTTKIINKKPYIIDDTISMSQRNSSSSPVSHNTRSKKRARK
jgi:serine/threonine protein kinase